MKGAIHVHSTYSDGEYGLAELRALFVAQGCRFVCVTDHAKAFDISKLERYVAECAALSDDQFLFVPGLEFDCDRKLHLLGIGVTALCDASDPQKVIEHVRRRHGIAVVAHPQDTSFQWIESFAVLPDGIEVWNTKYDGRHAPRPGTFWLLRKLRDRSGGVHAYYGQDLHWRHQHRDLLTDVDTQSLDSVMLLQSLRRGTFVGMHGQLRLPATGEISSELLDRFTRLNRRTRRMRGLIWRLNRLRLRAGIAIPNGLKAQLRRLF